MMKKHLALCLCLLTSPALADAPVPPTTGKPDLASSNDAGLAEAVVVDIAELDMLREPQEAAGAETAKQESATESPVTDQPPLKEVIELDVAPPRVVNRSRHFRIISRNAPAAEPSAPSVEQASAEQ